MRMPDLSETIVAVASAWQPSRIGILRVSGPSAFSIAAHVMGDDHALVADRYPIARNVRVALDKSGSFAASLLLFRGPRSYTGQDVVELHIPGSLPLLREMAGRLIAAGARRALPGEFSARALLLGKLDRSKADGVLGLVHAESEAAARSSARLVRGEASRLADEVGRRLLDLLARIEAGIDFVDEEDVRFVTRGEALAEVEAIVGVVRGSIVASETAARRQRPHVALAGLPNAGKSTLFNALLGSDRAIVSPVIGTTRDVLIAEPEFDGLPIVLQDTAGLGQATAPLDLAAHRAAEAAADEADVVLWAHDASTPWRDEELAALRRIRADERICVLTKIDVSARDGRECEIPPDFVEIDTLRVCAISGEGLIALKKAVAQRLRVKSSSGAANIMEHERLLEHLSRVIELLSGTEIGDSMHGPELVALELRTAWEILERSEKYEATEETLGRIFTRFCIGK